MKYHSAVSAANLFCRTSFSLSSLASPCSALSAANLSAELLSVSPVWRLFVQQSQLPISPVVPSFSQSLQCGVTLFSSLGCQSLLPSCSHSFQSGVSLFSASSSVSLSPLYLAENFNPGGPKFQDQSSGDIPKKGLYTER